MKKYRNSRKRSLLLVGLLFTSSEVTYGSGSFIQHRVRRTSREVPYDNTERIPVPISSINTIKPNEIYYTKSDNNNNNNDRWKYIHADADIDHPDRIWSDLKKALKNGKIIGEVSHDSSESNSNNNYRRIQEFTDNEINNNDNNKNYVDDVFVDEEIPNDGTITVNDLSETTDVNTTSTTDGVTSIGFNVTAETEYDVTDTIIVVTDETNDSNNETIISSNDTSTVIFTSNEKTNITTNGGVGTNKNNNTSSSYNSDSSSSSSNYTINDKNQSSAIGRYFRPIRMRAFLSDVAGGGQHLSTEQQTILLQHIIQPALLAWSAALRVEPVTGNLTVDSHQLIDGVSCGPGNNMPQIIIPTSHITTGIPDTDFILYISLAFQERNYNDDEYYDITNSNYTSSTLDKNLQNETLLSGNKQHNKGESDKHKNQDTDEEEYKVKESLSSFFQKNLKQEKKDNVTNTTDTLSGQKEICTGDYLAASAFCSTDQYDRPTAALLHLCIGDDFFDGIPNNIMLVLHELGHALGFNAVSLAHFRRSDGTPITPRDKNGDIPLTQINCTGPVGRRQVASVALPSEEILQFRTVRGGVRVAEVVSPAVTQVVRNHFDCQELPGAELESGEFLPLSTNEVSCLGDHWERRLFKTDLMNPLVDENIEFNPRFSTITLAYFADSGWYQIDLSRATLAASWGRAAGCDFVEETCVHDGQVSPQYDSFFCNQVSNEEDGYASDIHGCTPDLSRKASCSLGSHEGELPPEYQYFNFLGTNVGGNDPFIDYCPVYSGFANGLCSDQENEALIRVDLIEKFGQRNSRCLAGEITSTRYKSSQNNNKDGLTFGSSSSSSPLVEKEPTALCLPIACVVEDQSLRIQVDGNWEICTEKDQVIIPQSASSHSKGTTQTNGIASIRCPDPIRVCPTFYCNRDCLGSDKICNYNIGRCVCKETIGMDDDYIISLFDRSGNMPCEIAFLNEDEDKVPDNEGPKGSFYIPETGKDDGLPSPDSPLADYYVPTARNLREERKGFWSKWWKVIVSVSTATLCLVIAIVFYYVYRRRMHDDITDDNLDDGNAPSEAVVNPDKHKMLASIIVDLRTNNPILQSRIDALAGRESETDVSVTDTELSSEIMLQPPPSSSARDILFGPPCNNEGTIADLAEVHTIGTNSNTRREINNLRIDDDDGYVDPLAPPSASSPIFRRRHK